MLVKNCYAKILGFFSRTFIWINYILIGIILSTISIISGGVSNARHLVETRGQTTQRYQKQQQVIDRATMKINNNPQNLGDLAGSKTERQRSLDLNL